MDEVLYVDGKKIKIKGVELPLFVTLNAATVKRYLELRYPYFPNFTTRANYNSLEVAYGYDGETKVIIHYDCSDDVAHIKETVGMRLLNMHLNAQFLLFIYLHKFQSAKDWKIEVEE